MDLSKLSTEDLLALKSGDLSKVSTEGLMALRGESAPAVNPMTGRERLQMGLGDPFHGGAQLLTKMLPEGVVNAGNAVNNWLADKTGLVAKLPQGGVDEQVKQREADYQARKNVEGFDWMRLAGNALSPANLAFGAAGTASTLPARVGLSAAAGAGSAALSPVASGDFATEKAKQMGMGAVGGAAAPVLAYGVGRIISPNASRNPNLDLLKQEGVYPTVGQSLGGFANRAEEKMQSLPIVGDAITASRQRALNQFNQAAINRTVAPIGQSVDETGQIGVAKAGDLLSEAYNAAKDSIKNVKFDSQFQQDFSQLRQMSGGLTPPMKRQFDNITKDVLGSRVSRANAMLSDTFKKVDSELGQKAATYSGSSVGSEQELGAAVKQLQNLVRQQVARNDPQAAAAFSAADEGWANLVRVEGAAKAGKNAEGLFTPAQLNMAIQAADKSVRKRAVSRGEALMQDLANAGQQVLGNKVPNSGTADRAALGIGALSTGLYSPWIPAGLVAGAGMYTPPIQALLRGSVASRPPGAEAVASMLNQASPMFGPGAGLLGYQFANK